MIAATLASSRAYSVPVYSRPVKRHPSAACTSSVSALLRSRQHLAPKDCVHASLIALALGFEPSKHIGVEPRRYLLLDRLIEPSTLGGLPEILCQRRGITIVDTAIRHRLQGIQLGLLCLGQGGQIARIELEADGISVFLLHNVVFPFDRLFGPKRSDEDTSELQSLMRFSYAVFCLNTKYKFTPYTRAALPNDLDFHKQQFVILKLSMLACVC